MARARSWISITAIGILGFSGCSAKPIGSVNQASRAPVQLTILATNDIHGGVEPNVQKDGSLEGGLAMFSGVVKAVKAGLKKRLGDRSHVLVVDAGDQFQGTFVSNINEGQLVFKAMNQAGYDLVVTGNHDYDFGPVGWLDDQVTPKTQDQDSRGALKKLVKLANFPILSANTWIRDSLYDTLGNPVKVNPQGCTPITEEGQSTPMIDWKRAKTLDFLTPYLIKDMGGVKVAVIGIDNPVTPTTTTPANVSDLCFEDEAQAYLRVRRELDGKADVFVLVVHDGDASAGPGITGLLQQLTSAPPFPHGAVVDAAVAGHTHYINNVRVADVPGIQSGANGKMYGRIDLFYDPASKTVDHKRTLAYAGVDMFADRCADGAKSYCTYDAAKKVVSYEGMPFQSDDAVTQLVASERASIASYANRVVGHASAPILVDRVTESPLADALTDLLRELSGADVALMNTGGIRAPLSPGDVTYEELFRVIPFNNHGVKIGPVPVTSLLQALTRSAQACGDYGALMQSGLKVAIEKDCSPASGPIGTDTKARLLHVETLKGDVLLDVAAGVQPKPGQNVIVATLDFLAAGGDGFGMLGTAPLIEDMGIVREAMTDFLLKAPATFAPKIDGRWTVQKPAAPAR